VPQGLQLTPGQVSALYSRCTGGVGGGGGWWPPWAWVFTDYTEMEFEDYPTAIYEIDTVVFRRPRPLQP